MTFWNTKNIELQKYWSPKGTSVEGEKYLA